MWVRGCDDEQQSHNSRCKEQAVGADGAMRWRGRPNATMRDLILAIRMDEANHRDVNHTFAALKPNDSYDTNPMVNSH